MMPTPLCHVASLHYNFKTFFSSTIRLSSVFNLRLLSIDSFASMSAPRSSAVRSLFVAAILLCVFLFFQFLEFLFRYILQQVLLDIVLRRQLEAVFADRNFSMSTVLSSDFAVVNRKNTSCPFLRTYSATTPPMSCYFCHFATLPLCHIKDIRP